MATEPTTAQSTSIVPELRQKKVYSVATFDIEIHRSMDFLGSAGFLFLAESNHCESQPCIGGLGPTVVHLTLSIWVLLQECPDALNMAGPDCAPWGLPARGTTGRSILNVLGRQDLSFVTDGNRMISRSLDLYIKTEPCGSCMLRPTAKSFRLVLFCLVCLARHLIFVVENPTSSMLPSHPRWDWFQNHVCWEPCMH